MRYLKIFLAIYICFGATLASAAQEPVIRAYADKRAIFIGDRIRYTIKTELYKDFETEIPKFQDKRIGDFEIKDSEKVEKASPFGKRTTLNWYSITIYRIGKYTIPSIEVKFKKRGENQWCSKKTDEIGVTVESVLPKRRAIKDIKDIKGPIYFHQINWFLVFVSLALAAASVLAILFYRKRRMRLKPRLPHEMAFEELGLIRTLLSTSGDIKEYYVRISDCIRHYIEKRFSIKAPEMTTEEFLASLKESAKLSSGHKSLLKEFLNSCDLVKFAKYNPTRKETESVYSTAKNFVDQTKEVPAEKQDKTRDARI
ncbi:MAG: hypothetical protein HZA72_03850 [Candidatus Omnitrophica bacterium]|nr:hypothetical protein [Candidatus Omnitrophota bacterium]